MSYLRINQYTAFDIKQKNIFLFWLRRDIKYLFILIIDLAGEVKQDLQ